MRILVLASALGLLTSVAYGQQQEPTRPPKPQLVEQAKKVDVPKVTVEKPMSFWMATKLELSKSILESLTKADFEKLAASAEQMRLLGKLEGFVRSNNQDYQTQMHTFELANLELVRLARKNNIEGAAMAFNQLTSSCVACHKLLREGVQ